MAYYPFEFEAPIERKHFGDAYAYTVVFAPPDIVRELPLETYPRLRVNAEVQDHPLDAALTPSGGRWYILLSKRVLSAIGAQIGEEISVRFRVADQDEVEVPKALLDALAANVDMQTRWRDATPGKKRGLAYRVSSAKTEPTRRKRIQEVFGILEGRLDMRGKPVVGTR